MFILSSISSSLEFSSVNHTSIYENSESNIFKNIKFLGEIFNNWLNDVFGTNVCKTRKTFVDNYYWQYYNGLMLLQQFLNKAYFH